jgi:drug/metabolite transporter (DMT)-like permease
MARSPRSVAALQALLVVFIWSTSFVLAKWAFRYGFQPLTLSGVRFGLAALLLTPLALRRARGARLRARGQRGSLRVPIALGLAGYTVNAGGYNLGLFYLSPAEVALLLGLNNTLQVLVWARLLLNEIPTRLQTAGISVGLLGALLFYDPAQLRVAHPAAIAAVLLAGVGYALWIVGNRHFVGQRGSSLHLTWQSMASGAAVLLSAGLAVDGVPHVAAMGWLIVVVLAVVNTAFAFVLWGHTQKLLKSYESVVINNTQTVQVALLALVFLGDTLSTKQSIAILLVTASAITVQLAGARVQVTPGTAETSTWKGVSARRPRGPRLAQPRESTGLRNDTDGRRRTGAPRPQHPTCGSLNDRPRE